MPRTPPVTDVDESKLVVSGIPDTTAGWTAVKVALQRIVPRAGVGRTLAVLRRVNQRDGIDCPGCAWPEPSGRRRPAEFCENGAKALAEEATRRVVDRHFFAAHPVAALAGRSEYWLGQQGRLAEPMVLREGAANYAPVGWDEAFEIIREHLAATDPSRAVFYTSGRTSNEAAFLYQLFARSYGTNNLPDCSNMCHESSGAALGQTIGVGKGSVSLEDVHHADLIVIAGQNPGSNHPRMLTALAEARANGAHIVAVNPLPEAGLFNVRDPQRVSGIIGGGTALAEDHLQIRLGGDMALFQALGHLLLEEEKQAPGTVLDRRFLDSHCRGVDEYIAARAGIDWEAIDAATGLPRERIVELARRLARSKATIFCWAMGLTQHRHAVPTLREAVNVLLLRGMIGKPGAGVCPVRGHSNVQGDRTMGIWEQMPEPFLAALDARFGIDSPRAHGLDVVGTLQALRQGRVDVFMALGGNFVSATPDTAATEAGMRRVGLTVQVSTKLNRSHVVHGRTALILPALARSDADGGHAAALQFVTVEDSMSVVHRSQGQLAPVSPHMMAEPVIVCRLARRVLGSSHPVPWEAMADDYDVIRDAIAAVVPGCEDYNARVRAPNGFVLPHPPRDERRFPTPSGKAELTVQPLTWPQVPPGRLLLQTVRSHDQYNTTIYGLEDRYRGISNGRRVVFINPRDISALGFQDRQLVDLVSEWPEDPSGVCERRASGFRIVAYPTARGCAAAYFPEANALVPTDDVAEVSNTPASKSVVIRLESPRGEASSGAVSAGTGQ